MRARSHTELDTRQRLASLATFLPSQNELNIDHQRTGYVSWIKRYYFHLFPFFFNNTRVLLEIIRKKHIVRLSLQPVRKL
jgi:hypothetical protein